MMKKETARTMADNRFQQEGEIVSAVFEIIVHYQPIPTMDIWYELGEDNRFQEKIPLSEVKEILTRLENLDKIIRQDGERWGVRGKAHLA